MLKKLENICVQAGDTRNKFMLKLVTQAIGNGVKAASFLFQD